MILLHGFPPVLSAKPEILVLGSMPGVSSLDANQYYAHPKNVFWDIVQDVYAVSRTLEYNKRLILLAKHGVALWDVIASCEREGSLDSSIVNQTMRLNDIVSLVERESSINTILLNGGKAAQLFQRYFVKPNLLPARIVHKQMPSTSPAYASMTYSEKLSIWREALQH